MKKIIATIMSVAIALVGLTVPVMAEGDPFCDKLEGTPAYDDMGCGGSTQDELRGAITRIIQAVIGVAGLVAVVAIIIGGINYMTSTGDAGKVEKAKKTILYALIGLAVCALAFAIVNWAAGIINSNNGSDTSVIFPTKIAKY